MINTLYTYESESTNPYENLAREEFFLDNLQKNECLLYLWQNKHTVVIGKNQHAYTECKVDELKGDGGYLARRLSGGGAVYYDLGNLNFTFVMNKECFDIPKQLRVITNGVNSFSPPQPAVPSGRNDIELDGKKFSGNAFYKGKENTYHHGTLMWNIDIENLSHYLNVSPSKLANKGVKSVRSRVTNLVDYCPSMTLDNLKSALILAFEKEYGFVSTPFPRERMTKDYETLIHRYESADYLYQTDRPSQFWLKNRFSWGEIDIRFVVKENEIIGCDIFSDAMATDFIEDLKDVFQNIPFSETAIIEAIQTAKNNENKMYIEDILTYLNSL